MRSEILDTVGKNIKIRQRSIARIVNVINFYVITNFFKLLFKSI